MAVNPPLPRTFTRQARPRKRGNSQAARITIAALLPLSQLIEIRLIGTLFLQDFLAVFMMIFLLATVPNKAELLRPMRLFFGLVAVWMAGTVISDIWVSSQFEDLSRGWSKIILFSIHALVLWLLSRGQLKILAIYLLSSGVVYIASATLIPDKLAELDPWKFGIGMGLLLIAASLSVLLSKGRGIIRHIPLVLALGIALVSLLLNSRSLFAIGLLSAMYAFGAAFLTRHGNVLRWLNRGWFLAIIVIGVLTSQIMMDGYGQLAKQGALGNDAREKYLMQTAGNMSLLQGGRPETLISFRVIADSPIVGHGSWARDRFYWMMYFDELKWRGFVHEGQWRSLDENQKDLIPTHSHLFGAWVESGILGVPIWIYSLVLAFNALFAVVKLRSVPSLFATITAFFVMWDVLFSPFGADARILKAAQLCVLISVATSLRTAAQQAGDPRRRPGPSSPRRPAPLHARTNPGIAHRGSPAHRIDKGMV